VLAAACARGPASPQQPTTATGVVFHDVNRNGARDPGEAGLPGIRVSNSREVVFTDADGRYQLPVDEDTILFVIKPRGWMTPVDALNLPRFYYIHKPKGSPKLKYDGVAATGPLPASVDFPLHKQDEPDRFRVLVFGDPQPSSMEDIHFLAHDIVEQVIGTDAAFGFTLGDIVSDKLELHEPLNRVVAHVGIPWYNVLGNHDMDYSSPDDEYSDEHFERVYGPPYYSFDYGPVHFIVLDDVIWHGPTEEKKGYYHGGLGEQQLEFLHNDLALVPDDQLIVLTMHIPIVQIKERKQLFRLIAQHPHTVSWSAHTHIQEHSFLGDKHDWPGQQPHHHVNFLTTCGSWWRGAPDEVGIPHTTMRDGAPNGWALVTFEGNRYSIELRVARRPADHQMNIYVPDPVPVAQVGETEVLANVFGGSERSTVQMRVEDGPWAAMERVSREDPYYAAIKEAEESEHPPHGTKLPKVIKSPHIWRALLPAGTSPGTHLLEVHTTDMFGHSYTGRRVIRVK
jgi:hypothetical protein